MTTKSPTKCPAKCRAEITRLKAKLKKAEAELRTLRAARKGKIVQETKVLKTESQNNHIKAVRK